MPKLSQLYQAFSRQSTALVLISFAIQGCFQSAHEKSSIKKAERDACMSRTSDLSVTAEQARISLAQCLKSVKSGSIELSKNEISPARPIESSPTSSSEQYKYCVLHKDQIKSYYDSYTSASVRLAMLERDLGSNSEQTIQARERVEEAESNLSRLLPATLIGGLSLIPDAALKFSVCNRSDFN